MGNELIDIEVAYALPQRQRLVSLRVPAGTTALEAVIASGLQKEFPEIEPESADIGIFSRLLDGKTHPWP